MRSININPYAILLEPFGKNTAPAIALAAIKALEKENDPILLVLASDHDIKNKPEFLKAIKKGVDLASKEKLITFGIIPNSPETGYGYIKSDKPFNNDEISDNNIVNFTEKPNLSTAKEFLKDKRFTWNSGMFVFKAKTILEEIDKYNPEIIKFCRLSLSKSNKDLDFQRLDKHYFSKCPNISIDFSVMEKTKKVK